MTTAQLDLFADGLTETLATTHQETTTMTTITAADGITLAEGDSAFNYYDRKPGTLGPIDADGWCRFTHDDGTSATLNGERLCSLTTATNDGLI